MDPKVKKTTDCASETSSRKRNTKEEGASDRKRAKHVLERSDSSCAKKPVASRLDSGCEPNTSSGLTRTASSKKRRDQNNSEVPSGVAMQLIFWEEHINQIQRTEPSVVSISRVRTKEFDGKISLVFTAESRIEYDVEGTHAVNLWAWWLDSGESTSAKIRTEAEEEAVMSFDEAMREVEKRRQESNKTPLKFSNTVTMKYIDPSSIWYKACSKEGCQKKVEHAKDSEWFCSKCQQFNDEFTLRYSTRMRVADDNEDITVIAFSTVVEELFKMEANELSERVEKGTESMDEFLEGFTGEKVRCRFRAQWNESLDGSGYELILAKLEKMED